MRGTPNEVTVANALDAATAEEQRERGSEQPTPAEIASAALVRLRADQETTASFIKDVVLADEDDPIPYAALANASDREIVCIDLTDGGTVWCYDLDGEPHWLEAEFRLWANDDDDATLPLATALIIFFVSIIAAAALLAFWFAVLPSSGN